MIPGIEYHRPATPQDAVALLRDGDAVPIAGGTWVLPQLGRRELRARSVVDLRDLGLDDLRVSGGEVEIGARVTYAQILADDELARAAPLLGLVAAGITGGVQLRNQATLGGSACYAVPSSDVPAVLVALDAQLELHGPDGPRTVPASGFFLGACETDRRHDEILMSMRFAATDGPWGYRKIKLAESSWPIATAVVTRDADEHVVTLGGVVATPVQLRVHKRSELVAAVEEAVTDPWGDVLAPADYRRRVAPAVARHAWDRMEAQERTRS